MAVFWHDKNWEKMKEIPEDRIADVLKRAIEHCGGDVDQAIDTIKKTMISETINAR